MKYCKAHLDTWKMRYINIYFIIFILLLFPKYVRRQETFVNLCHINVPEEIGSSFKNYKSPLNFNKILQKTNRSTS